MGEDYRVFKLIKVYTNFTLTDVYSTRLDDTRLPDKTQADRPPCKQTPTGCTQVRKEKTKKQRQKTHEENQLSLSLRAKVRFGGEWDNQPVAGLQRHPLQKSNRRYKSLVNGTGSLPSLFINHKLQLWRKKKKNNNQQNKLRGILAVSTRHWLEVINLWRSFNLPDNIGAKNNYFYSYIITSNKLTLIDEIKNCMHLKWNSVFFCINWHR